MCKMGINGPLFYFFGIYNCLCLREGEHHPGDNLIWISFLSLPTKSSDFKTVYVKYSNITRYGVACPKNQNNGCHLFSEFDICLFRPVGIDFWLCNLCQYKPNTYQYPGQTVFIFDKLDRSNFEI